MKAYAPQDHERAAAVGRLLRLRDTQGGVWLHESRRDLNEVDLSSQDQMLVEAGCESGFCWT